VRLIWHPVASVSTTSVERPDCTAALLDGGIRIRRCAQRRYGHPLHMQEQPLRSIGTLQVLTALAMFNGCCAYPRPPGCMERCHRDVGTHFETSHRGSISSWTSRERSQPTHLTAPIGLKYMRRGSTYHGSLIIEVGRGAKSMGALWEA
jgi:hypothetical protein